MVLIVTTGDFKGYSHFRRGLRNLVERSVLESDNECNDFSEDERG
jgi:hypothetical protein